MRTSLLLVLSAIALGACTEPTLPAAPEPGWLELTGALSFKAAGLPTFDGNAVVPATFAAAIADSAAGVYILAFNQTGPAVGDMFILRVAARRTGTFAECGLERSYNYPDGSTLTIPGNCQGHFLERVEVGSNTNTFRAWGQWKIMAGAVVVTDAGRRFKGTVSGLRLEGLSRDSTARTMLIDQGSFDLPLLTGDAATQMTYCFLANALGRSCVF